MNRRDEKLDRLINQRVRITWHDGTTEEGVLRFPDPEYAERMNTKCGRYYLESAHTQFSKSNVKSIEVLDKRCEYCMWHEPTKKAEPPTLLQIERRIR